MAYAALDYYALDELFTHEERMARDTEARGALEVAEVSA